MGADRITVVGAGFAGLTALRTLRRRARDAELTLIAPKAELHYLPGTIRIPSGKRRAQDLVVPLDNFLRRNGIRFHPAHFAADIADEGLVWAEEEVLVALDAVMASFQDVANWRIEPNV